MADLADGETTEMQGSGSKPYVLTNTGGVYSCSCPAWRNQGVAIERRTCKHLKKLRGEDAELKRVGSEMTLVDYCVGKFSVQRTDKPAEIFIMLVDNKEVSDAHGWYTSPSDSGL